MFDDSGITLTIEEGCDFIIDEQGDKFIALRKLSWNSKPPKWDIRKWVNKPDGSEIALKGVGFLTEEGPHTLTKVLCEQGFGHTDDILNGIKDRDDFRSSLNKILDPSDELYDPNAVGKEFFDPCAVLDDLSEE